MVRDTKLGKEEVNERYSNVGDDALMDLDERRVSSGSGRRSSPGDIPCARVTPKGETPSYPRGEVQQRLILARRPGT